MPSPSPVACLLKTAPYLDYRSRETGNGVRLVPRGRLNGCDFRPYVWAGESREQERLWLNRLFEEGAGKISQSHPPHVCLSCSCVIDGDAPEICIPGRGGNRYSHASWQECQEALERWRVGFRGGFPKRSHSREPGRPRAVPVSGNRIPAQGGILGKSTTIGDSRMNKDILAIVRGFRSKGYTVEQSAGTSHFFVRGPDGGLFTTLPSTPHARGVTEAQNALRKAPDLRAAQKTERKAAALGAPSQEERRPAPAERIGDLPEIRGGKLPVTAWWLWENMRTEAERGGQAATMQDRSGWIWVGHVSKLIDKLWPALFDAGTASRREVFSILPEYLRLTGHTVSVKNRGPNALNEYWVAGAWTGGPDTLSQARIAGGAEKRGNTQRTNIELVKQAAAAIAGTDGYFTTRQIIDALPDVNHTTISTCLSEIAASDYPITKIKSGTYQITGAHMTAPKSPGAVASPPPPRRSGLRIEVLHYKQSRPEVPESIAEVSKALNASETSVARILREWWLDGSQGIERLKGNLYAFRPHLLPEGHKLRKPLPRDNEEKPQAAVAPEPAAMPEQKPEPEAKEEEKTMPAGRKRIEDFIALRPDAKLYAEMFTTSDGVTVVIDENGEMRELRPKP